jgi:glycerol-3-phosphate cytidylyltransferase-like family protein
MKEYGTVSVVGVVSDEDAASYKRMPVIHEQNRVAMIQQCKLVDEVIFPCPLYVTPEFLKLHQIDVVIHGFRDDADYENQRSFFEQVNLVRIPYSMRDNTTDIIRRTRT